MKEKVFTKSLFAHVPKTGGCSIARALREAGVDILTPKHHRLSGLIKLYRPDFTFSFVRNPFERLVSAYFYLSQDPPSSTDKRFYVRYLKKIPDFASFVKILGNCRQIRNYIHFRPQVFYLDAPVDFLGKTENINRDFGLLCSKLDMKKVDLKRINRSNHNHYKSYYDEKSTEIVLNVYKEDFETFGYEKQL